MRPPPATSTRPSASAGSSGRSGPGPSCVRPGLRLPLLIGAIGLAAGVAALGLTGSLGPALLAMTLASAGSLLTEVVSTTIFQRIVPDEIRGRALGGIATISTLAYATGSLVLPIAAGAVGTEPVLIASGVLVVSGVVVSILLIGSGADRGLSAEAVSTAASGRLAADLRRCPGVAPRRCIRPGRRAGGHRRDGADPAGRSRRPVLRHPRRDVRRRSGRPRTRPCGGSGRWAPTRSSASSGCSPVRRAARRSMAATDGRLLALEAADFLELVESGAEVGPRLLALHRGGANAA